MIKVENNPFFREEPPKVKVTFTVKEVNDLVSTIAQYVADDISVKEWCDKMIRACGNNADVFNHSTDVIQDAIIHRLNKLLNK